MKSNPVARFLITAIAYGSVGLISIAAATFVATQFVFPILAQEDSADEVEPKVVLESVPEYTVAQVEAEELGELQPVEVSGDSSSESAGSNSAPDSPPSSSPSADSSPVIGQVAPQEIPSESGQTKEATITIENLKEYLRPFNYEPGGRRDPFQPFVKKVVNEVVDATETPTEEGALTSLERFDLDQIELLGIIWQVNNPKVMIRDPTGRVHIVGKNTKIGRNNGYIAVIREGELVIVESFDSGGDISYQTRIMKIR